MNTLKNNETSTPNSINKTSIGNRVRRQRQAMNLSREEFAELIEISMQFLAEIENGKKGMSAETLCKICEKSNVSADYILFGYSKNDVSQNPLSTTLSKIPHECIDAAECMLEAFVSAIDAVKYATNRD